MLNLCSLQSLFLHQCDENDSSFEHALSQFLIFKDSPSPEVIDSYRYEESFLSEEIIINNWRRLLKINILCHLADCHQTLITAKIRQFERHPWNKSSQYFRALVALNHALTKMPIPEVGPHLLESGAALIDLHEYCPWLAIPYTPQHFEFGVYLSLLGLLTERQDLQESALSIARWQLNTLDVNGQPLAGFFAQEKEGRSLHHLCWSYLLFKCAALLKNEQPYAAVAEATLKLVLSTADNRKEKLDPLWILIEQWLNQRGQPDPLPSPLELPENIHDASTALAGYRSEEQYVVCTLHGEHTGLGALRYRDVEIVTYGPQHLPLGECSGFGIEGNALSDHGVRRTMIEWKRTSFVLKGCTRLVDQPTTSSSLLGDFRGIWLEVAQEFKRPHFYLKTSFLGLEGWDSVAMSFFIKAASCKVGQRVLHPRTLDRYNGNAETVILQGSEGALELRPLGFEGAMHIIPLAGGDSFWGADFLIAYLMDSNQRHYQWHAGPLNN